MCFRSHCVSLFGSFQKVTERSRMVVTIQHHIIWNTFNRQSAKIILDNIQCTSNFNMNMFSKSDAAIQTFLCLAKSDSLAFHLYILFGLARETYLHFNTMVFFYRVFFSFAIWTNLSISCLETLNAFFVIASFFFHYYFLLGEIKDM